MDPLILLGLALLLVLLLVGVLRFVRRITVFEFQHAVRFVRGTFAGLLSPGSYWIITPVTSIRYLEARPHVITIPGQEVLSADAVSLKVSLLLTVQISDPKATVLQSADYQQSLYASAQTALRTAIGETPIEAILQSRGELSTRLQTDVGPAASAIGVDLQSISIKDIMFPGSLKEAFSQTARAKQEGQAALERARGETAALRHLANAARMLENNPNLFQLRLLQTASAAGKVVLTVTPPEGTSSRNTPTPEA